MRREVLSDFTSLLIPSKYQEVHRQHLNIVEFSSYRALAKRIGAFYEDPDLERVLVVSTPGGNAFQRCVAAPIQRTLKTHKPVGQVSFRNLHDCLRFTFRCLAKWISIRLQPRLAQYQHLAKDTPHIKSILSRLSLPKGCWLVKGDVKDYFMSGSHQFLARAAANMMDDDNEAALMFDAVYYVLDKQYVTPQSHNDQIDTLYKVREGAGMGLPCSGEIADCAFVQHVEAFLLDESVRKQLQVIEYARCKDDF